MVPNLLLWAYFSPETYLPITSVIATVVGVVMMFGRNSLRFLMSLVWSRGKAAGPRATSLRGPHFRPADPARDTASSARADEG